MEENAKIRNKEKRRLRGKPTNNNYHQPEPGDLTAGLFYSAPEFPRPIFQKCGSQPDEIECNSGVKKETN